MGDRTLTRPVRVGLLAYGLDRPLSGVTRVALEIGRALMREPRVEVTFLTPYRVGPFVGEPGAKTAYLPGCRLLPGLMLLGGAVLAAAARRHRLDVVHDPIGIAPFTVGRRIAPFGRLTTIHDAIAFEYPQGYPLLNNFLHRVYVPRTLANVDLIATVSNHAADSLAHHLHVARGKLRVVPSAVSGAFDSSQATQADDVIRRFGLERPYVFYVGAFKEHKNLVRLVQAFALVRKRAPELRLVLAGPRQWRYPDLETAIDQLALGDAVSVLGYVPEADLPALYAGSVVFVLPSLHEGFGLPILEAMACGAPVVCSSADALPEVAGEAALLVDPLDVSGLADAIFRVHANAPLAASLRAAGRRRVAEFSWARAAGQYSQIYLELAA